MGRLKELLMEVREAMDDDSRWPAIQKKYHLSREELALYVEDEEIEMLENWEREVSEREFEETADKYTRIADELESSWDNFKPHIPQERVITGEEKQ